VSPTTNRRGLLAVALTTGVAVAALGMTAPATAAATSASISPKSGAVGTTIKVTGNCGDVDGTSWLPAEIGLYYSDAFETYGGKSTFATTTTPTAPNGAYAGTIVVPARAVYTSKGPSNAAPGPEVRRAVTGQVSVQVQCYTTLSSSPWNQTLLTNAFTVRTATAAKTFSVTTQPKVIGKKRVGKKLTAKPGTWAPEPSTISYQWKRGTKAITNATAKKYKLKKADAGKKVSVVVTGKRSGYTTLKVSSKKVKIKSRS
jgi:hypothetical protein